MPPKFIKTVRQIIYWQYAKIISNASGYGKEEHKMNTSIWKRLCSGEIHWSTSVREWLKEKENPDVCIYCGEKKDLTTEHILPRCCGGEDIAENVVRVCKSCNSSKGGKRLYEWIGYESRNNVNRIAEGKYLKYLYSAHEKRGTLDTKVSDLCEICNMGKTCERDGYVNKLTVYCIEGCFHK